MTDPLTTGIASAGGSVAAYALISCWRRHKDKTKVRGCLLPLGKSYAEKNLIEDNETVFFDLDGSLSVEPLRSLDRAKMRLELYPEAVKKALELKRQQRNKTIVLCSEDYELLKHIGMKDRHIKAYLPTQKFFTDNNEKIENKAELEKARMAMEISIPKKQRVYYSSFDELTKKLTDKYYRNKNH